MQVEVVWSDLWVPVFLMMLSVVLDLLARRRRVRSSRPVRPGARTHWWWLPFMFGLSTALGELAVLLDVPGAWTTVLEAVSYVFAVTTVFMAVRVVLVLLVRGVRRGRTWG
ncbi:hypothetical protein [Streptomyces sp. NPDC059783]|uniref:hypothetical protein n=1 Tax=Streptomyces sp. NPDC059783 TaxID=3346944 RepID=UPI003646FF92